MALSLFSSRQPPLKFDMLSSINKFNSMLSIGNENLNSRHSVCILIDLHHDFDDICSVEL